MALREVRSLLSENDGVAVVAVGIGLQVVIVPEFYGGEGFKLFSVDHMEDI